LKIAPGDVEMKLGMITLIHHPDDPKRMGDLLVENLSNTKWITFRAAVAFVKNSGVKHIKAALQNFLAEGNAKISTGIDHAGTSKEGLSELLEALGTKGEGWVFHNNEGRHTFHPKVYLFENATCAECFIGSGNLTEGGLFTNYEAFVQMRLDNGNVDDQKILAHLHRILDTWTDSSQGMALKLTPALVQELVDKGLVPTEAQIAQVTGEAEAKVRGSAKESRGENPFASKRVPAAPKVASLSKQKVEKKKESKKSAGSAAVQVDGLTGFFMTLQQTDVGKGQTTRGASKRSPEIFIPLAARDANPSFWGWNALFRQDPSKPGKYDRTNVRMMLRGHVIHVNMMTWPDKSDFRLRNAELRDTGKIGDVLRIMKADGKAGFDYSVEIIESSSPEYATYVAMCDKLVRRSKKRWGYH
jgi:HKD family nuclease